MYRLLFAMGSFACSLEVADMYPAFLSACLPWPCWDYARASVSLVTRSIMTIRALRLWVAYLFRSMHLGFANSFAALVA